MRKTKIIAPYNKEGKTNLKHVINKSGVYIIYDSKNRPSYIGYSGTNLYKTILRHFQQWNDWSQYRAKFTRDDHKVRIILCTPSQAAILENALINKYMPNFNKQINLLYPKGTIKKALETYEGSEYVNLPF